MEPTEKPFWRSKTFWIQVLTIAAGMVALIAESEWAKQNTQTVLILTTVIVPILNLIVRQVTTTQITWKLK